MNDDLIAAIALSTSEKEPLVEKKATCPFIGSAIAEGTLAVRNSAEGPLAENLLRDTKSKVFGTNVAALLAGDLLAFVETLGPALISKLHGSEQDTRVAHRDLEQKLTKLLGEDNLIGSSGEFGLLFSFVANKPGAREIDGEPAVSVQELNAVFVEKRLPDGWENWKKTRTDWVRHTIALMVSAAQEYQLLRRTERHALGARSGQTKIIRRFNFT
jgi:hypothetical protein